MPTRRTVLRTAVVLTGGAFAGCGALERGSEGYVQLKSVAGVTEGDERIAEHSIVRVDASFSNDEPPELRRRDDELAERFDAPRNLVVSDALHDELSRRFDRVRYVVGVCCPAWADDEDESVGCYNVATTRENFNSVQVHDRVRASSDGTYLTIHSVDGTWTFRSD